MFAHTTTQSFLFLILLLLIDKCQTFGMRKENDIYKQYMPVITTSDTLVPAVKIDGSYKENEK